MNIPKEPVPSKQKLSPAKLGIVIGIILGVLGTVAGFYFGVLRPALSSGQFEIPARSLWAGIVLIAVLVVACGVWLWRWIRGSGQRPRDQDGEDW